MKRIITFVLNAVNTNVIVFCITFVIMKTLAERLAWIREKRELTQQELASKARVSQGAIGNLESGRTDSSRDIAEIAYVLGVDARWLACGKGEPFRHALALDDATPVGEPNSGDSTPTAKAPQWMDANAFRLLNFYWSLDSKDRAVSLEYIRTLALNAGPGVASNDG